MLARSHIGEGRWHDALAVLTNLCGCDAAHAQDWFLLGALNGQLERYEEAIECCRRAIARRPDHVDAHYNLAQTYLHCRRPEAAATEFRRVVELRPDHFDALNNLGYALQLLGQYAEAVACHERALVLQPQHPDALVNLGIALHGLGKPGAAIEAYQAALRVAPGSANAWYNLGYALDAQERHAQATAAYQRAIELQPDNMAAYANLGTLLLAEGRHAETDRCLRAALAVKPGAPETTRPWQALLFALNAYETDSRRVAREHRAWGRWMRRLHAPQTDHANDPDPERPLRVGYVSADFRNHSVASFFEPLLSHHDPAGFHVVCYADVHRPDRVTRRLQHSAAAWRDIRGLGDGRVAELIQRDGIDLLVDLAGHTSFNRLSVFARKPAPVQVTWLGYPNTTGLEAIDYRLTDAVCDPPGTTEHLHTEELIRLPHGFLCYLPSLDAPSLCDPPSETRGHLTFGAFNNLSKVTPEAIRTWARILLRLPRAHLIMKNKPFRDPATRARYSALFSAQGVDPGRVELLHWLPGTERHLAQYNRVDIALDTFPYNGTTTTCEALWMGVPVITLRGAAHAGRVGAGLLHAIGLTEWVAGDQDRYVELAVRLAGDARTRKTLRAGLRGRMLQSPLCDGKGFARQMEETYRDLWRRWCRRGAATGNGSAIPSA